MERQSSSFQEAIRVCGGRERILRSSAVGVPRLRWCWAANASSRGGKAYLPSSQSQIQGCARSYSENFKVFVVCWRFEGALREAPANIFALWWGRTIMNVSQKSQILPGFKKTISLYSFMFIFFILGAIFGFPDVKFLTVSWSTFRGQPSSFEALLRHIYCF